MRVITKNINSTRRCTSAGKYTKKRKVYKLHQKISPLAEFTRLKVFTRTPGETGRGANLELHAPLLGGDLAQAGLQHGVLLGVDVQQTLAELGVLGAASRQHSALLVQLRTPRGHPAHPGSSHLRHHELPSLAAMKGGVGGVCGCGWGGGRGVDTKTISMAA